MEENQESWHIIGPWFLNISMHKTHLGSWLKCRAPGSIPRDYESTGLTGYVFVNPLQKILKQVLHRVYMWTSKHSTGLGFRRPCDRSFTTIRGATLRKSLKLSWSQVSSPMRYVCWAHFGVSLLKSLDKGTMKLAIEILELCIKFQKVM